MANKNLIKYTIMKKLLNSLLGKYKAYKLRQEQKRKREEADREVYISEYRDDDGKTHVGLFVKNVLVFSNHETTLDTLHLNADTTMIKTLEYLRQQQAK